MTFRLLFVALLLWLAPVALAHETDNFSLPREQPFADLGPLFDDIFYVNVARAVDHLNSQIRTAIDRGASPQELAALQSPDKLEHTVRRTFPATLSLIDDVDRMLASEDMRRRYPGLITGYMPFSCIYDHTSFILDPRQVFKLWRAATIRVGEQYIGTDKIGHFIAKGHILYEQYRKAIHEGLPHDQAVQEAVNVGIGDDFFYSEKRMVGYFSSGVMSHGDLAVDFAGLHFFINLTEPVQIGDETRPAVVERAGDYWKVADHVEPEAGLFTFWIGEHINEVYNPNRFEPLMRNAIAKELRNRREAILARYSDRFGNQRSRAWFLNKSNELSTYHGTSYGRTAAADELVDVANVILAPHDFNGDVHARSPLGWTALHQAAADGDVQLLAKILNRGADVNAEIRSEENYNSEWGSTPLHFAARDGHVEAAKILLANEAQVNARNDRGVTPLHLAVRHPDMLALLLENGADAAIADQEGRTALHCAVTYDAPIPVALLIEHEAPLAARDAQGRAALHYAAFWNQPEHIKALIDSGAAPDAVARYNRTPLHLAAEQGQTSAIAALLAAGASATAADTFGRTALHAAAERGSRAAASKLIQHEASVNAADTEGNTPLHEAARRGHEHIALWLIEHGADVDAGNAAGRTPLHAAASAGRSRTLSALVTAGADPARVDAAGRTAQTLLDAAAPNLTDSFVSLGRLK